MNWLWTSEDLIAAMHGRPFGNPPPGITGISIDSRSVAEGEAFFAIKGDRVDGHDFASFAMANGAGLLVVSEGKLPALGRLTVPMIVVPDVLQALVDLGCAARDRSAAKVIAVTGSVGKTTTKEMLRHALSDCGSVHASVASFNNHWGVPLTLARMPENTSYGVFEIGMNHPDEIRPLVKMVRPHVAVVTSIAAAHLGNFKDLSEIAAAKSEIFEGVAPGGHALITRDSEQFQQLEAAAQASGVKNIHTFGAHPQAEFRLIEYTNGPEGSVLWAAVAGQTLEIPMGAPGRHIAENAVAVLGAASLVGADIEKVMIGLSTMKPEKGRGRRYKLAVGDGSFTLIDESYNANPASMRAAIALLRDSIPQGEGRRIAVLGDMLEMGEFSSAVHGELAGPLADAGIEDVWLGGPEMKALKDVLPESVRGEYRENTDQLVPFVVGAVRAGDVLVVKSSKGTGFSSIVAALLDKYQPFSDTGPAN
ncbi:UDP-N-acetylmuramoylalanyl-D-glutamyl-2,6-diaminopimelate--D-alanyl-D-alanine ligase [Sinorhizobium sp. BG8]|uniref:UDP-N-acetylmuramoylalanyl-D-glutamyl-2, 6-diaminopimelate--D-alanyl-D-alanine ligase n=1 Tax=Sinorhizobium sp. BG8 TaxID=2613773 RepID=UPI00193E9943|nr:UDP-N-acetylmuramoylalanyl-D-glutamyl-2,6-diaminopimelate--D-alanyl-D-alanine ligase [Sinorhizobium sp. BG8]QRM55993.1 UDP-N-acetylmuramoylalanyl-D-glutamyl-2,6-diaminopimelate--D-alanyl-D-alanine ligase [Sinorhizobium sp. BG8]